MLQGGTDRRALALQQPNETEDEAISRSMFDSAVTGIFLYALIVEQATKIAWSLEMRDHKEAPHTHNIWSLFGQLSAQAQADIKAIYTDCCRSHEEEAAAHQDELSRMMAGNGRPHPMKVDMASIQEAMDWNCKAMVNFKYDHTGLGGKAIPCGAMWWDSPDGSEIPFLPRLQAPSFGRHLLSHAVARCPEDALAPIAHATPSVGHSRAQRKNK